MNTNRTVVAESTSDCAASLSCGPGTSFSYYPQGGDSCRSILSIDDGSRLCGPFPPVVRKCVQALPRKIHNMFNHDISLRATMVTLKHYRKTTATCKIKCNIATKPVTVADSGLRSADPAAIISGGDR